MIEPIMMQVLYESLDWVCCFAHNPAGYMILKEIKVEREKKGERIKVSLVCCNEKCANFTEETILEFYSGRLIKRCRFYCPCCGQRFEQISWEPCE